MSAPMVTRPPRWWTAAACANEPTDTFFASGTRQVARAVAICHTCPVSSECLRDALDRGEEHGVWGGQVFPVGPRRRRR